MIEYTLHKLPQGFIITSGDDFHNNNLVPNDFAYHRGTKEVLQVISKNNETGSWLCNDGTNRDCYKLFKVIAQQDQIDFSVLKEEEQKEIGWFDVENFALDSSGFLEGENYASYKLGVLNGFKKAQELLSDRKFTEEYMRNAIAFGVNTKNTLLTPTGIEIESNKFIQSLSQQSWKVELEMEDVFHKNEETHITDFDTPNLAVKSNYSTHYKQPKLKEGKIKILKLLW